MMDVLSGLRQCKIIPVLVIEDASDADAVAAALTEGGLPCAEVTFRTAAAPEALRRMSGEHPNMLVGAGTVLTAEQAAQARSAGARFIVSPGFNPSVVEYCIEHDIPVYPGVCTPTEIEGALEQGLTVLKFFPAEPIGGLPYLKAIAAPYSHVEFIPTGGINLTNLHAYLSFSQIVACGGSWMVSSAWIRQKDFGQIQRETANAVRTVQKITGGGRV
jgi:2-dehydro-3-deoxyphosphogluconate aldolase/(4S)-4-hydroxy-2-oxoglutarate aldolase